MSENTAMGRIVILQWCDVKSLMGVYIIPLGLIPQEVRRPRLIYNYMWIFLNTVVLYQAP